MSVRRYIRFGAGTRRAGVTGWLAVICSVIQAGVRIRLVYAIV